MVVVALSASVLASAASSVAFAQAAPAADPAPGRQVLTDELEATTGGTARVVTSAESGAVTMVAGSPTAPLTTAATPDHGASARAFVDRYGSLYGPADPGRELVEDRRAAGVDGGTAVRYQQRQHDIPVVGAEVAVQVGPDGRVLSSTGRAVQDATVDVIPTVTADDARASAVVAVTRSKTGEPIAGAPTATAPQLWLYDPAVVRAGGPPGLRLVWRLEVTVGDVRALVLVDAHVGTVTLRIDENAEAKNRSVCDNQNVVGLSPTCTFPSRVEGGPTTGRADVDNAYLYAGLTYDFYANRFGRDSIDAAGLPLISTVRYCPTGVPCPYANAFWNGSQMVYGAGFANADDVVGHELTHGVTENTSHLLYLSQSGAINESMSDVFGELIDQSDGTGNDGAAVKWLIGEDLPVAGIGGTGALRSMSNPAISLTPQPDRMTSPKFYGGRIDHVGVHINSGVGNKTAVLITDGGSFNGQTITGLGLAKAALLYYQVQSSFLGPASGYADLGNALGQACTNLVGTAGFTAGDCTNVAKATTATELSSPPVTAGSTVPAAPVCPAGQGPTPLFSDDMENPASGSWLTNTVGGAGWAYDRDFAASPTTDLHGPDGATAGTLTVRRTAPVSPPVGRSTYLRFNHAYQFEFDGSTAFDGGRIEYSTNGGAGWADAGGLVTDNGYTGTIATGFGNPQGGRAAFVFNSPGYQSSRVNLSPLAGQNVLFRFLIGTDSGAADLGWYIDDVSVYSCDPLTTPGAVGPVTTTPMHLACNVVWAEPAALGGSPITGYRVTTLPGGAVTNVAGPDPQAVVNGLSDGTPYTFTIEAQNAQGFGPGTVSPTCTPEVGPGYHGLTPSRVLDSRDGTGGLSGKWGAGATRQLTVAGAGGVPVDATAVVLNVTVANPTAASHLIVWPAGVARPTASNLNFAGGQTIANLVQVKLGTAGQISIFNNAGSTDVLADVVGYYDGDGLGDALTSVTPFRLLDSRIGTGGLPGAWGAQQTRDLQVTGVAGSDVPASGVSAVVLNVTAVNPSTGSHLTVFPQGQAMPLASNLNFVAGQTTPNLVIARVGPTGQVSIFNNAGSVDVLADVVGYFSALPTGGRYTALTPTRLLDTRTGNGGFGSPWSGSLTRELQVAGRGNVPRTGATAVVLNVTAVFPSAPSHLTLWETGALQPTASNLNVRKGDVVPNLVIVQLGPDGKVNLFNNAGRVDVLADVVGYYR